MIKPSLSIIKSQVFPRKCWKAICPNCYFDVCLGMCLTKKKKRDDHLTLPLPQTNQPQIKNYEKNSVKVQHSLNKFFMVFIFPPQKNWRQVSLSNCWTLKKVVNKNIHFWKLWTSQGFNSLPCTTEVNFLLHRKQQMLADETYGIRIVFKIYLILDPEPIID